MKKNQIILLASSIFIAGSLLACGGKKQSESTQQPETTQQQPVAVDTSIPGINGTKYNAAFFNDTVNKGETPGPDKYVETPTGLKYVIVEEGSGISPTATSEVTVHYVGTLTDGKEFDSSISRGEPAEFPLSAVIPGWTEGLQYMKEGGVAVFYIPSNIAYGERGSYNPYTGQYTIPPSAPLLFWVQLLNVK